MSAANIVRAALDDLCRACHISPADGTYAAGRAVAERIAAYRGAEACPVGGPLSRWLRAACPVLPGDPRALVLDKRVMLRYGLGDKARTEFVDLPAAVRVAVKLGIHWRIDPGHAREPVRRHRAKKGAA